VLLLVTTLSLLAGMAVSATVLKNYLVRDTRFRIAGVNGIQASGLSEVSREEMLPVFGEDVGRNIFFVPLNVRRKQLEEIPWVERATVMRLLPDHIRVSIVERQPVAFALQPNGLTGLVDADGVLLSMPAAMMAQRHYTFPVVSGINSSDSAASRRARMVYQRLLDELDANGQKLSAQISEIDLSDPSDARVLMPEQGGDILAHFGDDRFMERYQRYKAHIAEWRQQYPRLGAVDLRYEQQAVLEMAAGSNGSQAAAGDENPTGDAKPGEPAVAKLDAKQAKLLPKAEATQAKTLPVSSPKAVAVKAPVKAPVKAQGKVQAKAKAVKAAGPKGQKMSAKSGRSGKDHFARVKSAKVSTKAKKQAAVKRAALKPSRQTSAPGSAPAVSAGMGQ
jgi:cell division protein FtsQ